MKNLCTGRILCSALAVGASLLLANTALSDKGELKPQSPSKPAVQVPVKQRAAAPAVSSPRQAAPGTAAGAANPLAAHTAVSANSGGIAGACSPPNANETCDTATDAGVIAQGSSHTFTGSALCALPDCELFVFGEGNLWVRFEMTVTANVKVQYCGSSTTFGGPWGNMWLNFATGCPCGGFTNGANSFGQTCADGNFEATWLGMAPGVYYYPVLIDSVNSALGNYSVTISVLDPPPPCSPPNANEVCETATDAGVLNLGDSHLFTGSALCAQPDCPLFTLGDGNLWLRFETVDAADVKLSYCGSVSPVGPWGDAWLNLATGCPCAGFTNGASFGFTCADGNVELKWGALPAGVYYYPILIETAFNALGDYNILVSVNEIVPVCPNPDHDCNTAGTPGCSDEFCCNLVCGLDPFCCQVQWDGICVGEAATNCFVNPCPNLDHDCATQGTPGCSDDECCNKMCIIDPFCCSTQWDGLCVNEAGLYCCPADTCPWDTAGVGGPDGQVNIDDLLGVINHWGACP